MQPGDLYIYNDSYGSKGAVSHNNDMVFIQPIYAEGRLKVNGRVVHISGASG